MIVKVTFPNGVTEVKYGKGMMLVDENHQLDVPAYVAKTLLTLQGTSAQPAIPETAQQLLAAIEDRYETNNLFWAHGQRLPQDEVIKHEGQDDEIVEADWLGLAGQLLLNRGEPVVSAA